MAGLNRDGFIPLTIEEITQNIQSRLTAFNEGFDFSPESPDGQLIDIFSILLAQIWTELELVYHSYNPNDAIGAALKNVGLITGLEYGAASTSSADIELTGTAGTIVWRDSLVTDDLGNEFAISADSTIPSTVTAIAQIAGIINVAAGALTTIKTPLDGWDAINQPSDGNEGELAWVDSKYRNIRNRTVLRNYTSTVDTMQARLIELGLEQARVVNNDSLGLFPDGTPAQSIQVFVGEVGSITDEEIAETILDTTAMGCPTYGTSTVTVDDSQGTSHDVSFTKSLSVEIFVSIDLTYLSVDSAGATDNIKRDINNHINNLLSGEDVIWSHLFGLITPHGEAQVNTLLIGKSLGTLAAANVVIDDAEYAICAIGNIEVVET